MRTLYFLDQRSATRILNEQSNLPIIPKKSEWIQLEKPNRIARTYFFDSYEQVMQFVQNLMAYVNQIQHHPELVVKPDQVTVTTCTHQLNDVTEQDLRLSKMADELYIDTTYVPVESEVDDDDNDERLAERYRFDWTVDW
jgi:4a-hydroxytetrahydrobiopterin dehydratase